MPKAPNENLLYARPCSKRFIYIDLFKKPYGVNNMTAPVL